MPVPRPSLPKLIEQLASEMESRLPGILPRARRSLAGVLVRVFSGGLDALYKFLERVFKQAWPDQCDEDELPGHGARWGVLQKTAAPATGTLLIGGENGASLMAGSVFQRADGVQFTVDVGVTIVGSSATVAITADEVGQAGNTAAGVQLTLASPVVGINSTAVASTEISGGADVERPELFRARILERIRRPPHGGDGDDYVAWAKEVPGVTRAWCTPNGMGAGTVVVRFVRDDDDDPIPDAGEIEAVRAHIEAQRPVTAELFVLPVVAKPVAYVISDLQPDSAEIRAAIIAELKDMHVRDAIPGGTLLITHMREAISIAAGENDHVLVSPAGNVTCLPGELATFGGVTWA
ncbi:baseplate J/gp47 family protein [Achromobacter xylosoxidans]|uniref:baseplate J/gp47 family protein n=1 Tax=Alcaligenes xylosoxydans xylosoxydans TaxID=85698 RepID=UPI001F056E0B|nr:baseplate J/gp47 family protein [Achromobacter xylosoxidans]MCH1985282.1 baseplate J/gp47 family protein [Achromobacter xylosoxidans]MCH1993517.1 baseplate J/gp47 family protein [Achromobacter xylosoxidans]MCH4585671.1 baseplate J/gp47 family protein [Achromobacter xylosoxidans]